jgi:hypothetical protein
MSSDSLRRRDIISELHASSLYNLNMLDKTCLSFVTTRSFQPGVEDVIVALQSNHSRQTIGISKNILAAIGESDQGRLFCSLANLPTLQRMSLWGGTRSPTAIHTRVLADALSDTSNDIKLLELSSFKISSRSEVERLAVGLKARVASLDSLTLEASALDVEDKRGFLHPILFALELLYLVSPVVHCIGLD